jgi:hypothetical protein
MTTLLDVVLLAATAEVVVFIHANYRSFSSPFSVLLALCSKYTSIYGRFSVKNTNRMNAFTLRTPK